MQCHLCAVKWFGVLDRPTVAMADRKLNLRPAMNIEMRNQLNMLLAASKLMPGSSAPSETSSLPGFSNLSGVHVSHIRKSIMFAPPCRPGSS